MSNTPSHHLLARSHRTKGWSIFFAVIVVIIVTTLMLPAVFGFQKFTQWGGMFTDSWCVVQAYSDNPHTNPQAFHEEVIASLVGPPITWSPPLHNHMSCLMWAKQVQCGRVTKDGWTVKWADPVFKHVSYYAPGNACDVSDQSGEWYRSQLEQWNR